MVEFIDNYWNPDVTAEFQKFSRLTGDSFYKTNISGIAIKDTIQKDISGIIIKGIIDKHSISKEKRIFSGFGSVAVIDRQGDYIPMDEFKPVMEKLMQRGAPVTDSHSNHVVGKIVDYTYKPTESGELGLYLTAEIYSHYPTDDETWHKIQSGEYTGFSLGGKAGTKTAQCTNVGCYNILGDIEAWEFSIVERPANQLANIDKVNKLAKGSDVVEEIVYSITKERIYVKNPLEAPKDVKVQEGERGGYYYESSGQSKIESTKLHTTKPKLSFKPKLSLTEYLKRVSELTGTKLKMGNPVTRALYEQYSIDIGRWLTESEFENELKVRQTKKSYIITRKDDNYIIQKPFAGYKDFEQCVAENKDKGNPQAYCGAIKHRVEDVKKSKIYIHNPSDVPKDVKILTGKYGGKYYESETQTSHANMLMRSNENQINNILQGYDKFSQNKMNDEEKMMFAQKLLNLYNRDKKGVQRFSVKQEDLDNAIELLSSDNIHDKGIGIDNFLGLTHYNNALLVNLVQDAQPFSQLSDEELDDVATWEMQVRNKVIDRLNEIRNRRGLNLTSLRKSDKFTLEDVEKIGDELEVDWTKVDKSEFLIGINIELEHGMISPETNVTDDDEIKTAKIALAHINEFPDYYSKKVGLPKMEDELKGIKKEKG